MKLQDKTISLINKMNKFEVIHKIVKTNNHNYEVQCYAKDDNYFLDSWGYSTEEELYKDLYNQALENEML